MSNQRKDSSKSLAHQRKMDILEIIEARETVSTLDLAQKFSVSIPTITRDLQELEEKGLILRIHGGATSIRGGGYEYPFITRENRNLDEKHRIATAAYETIHEGDSILLDVGTTILELAKLLKTMTKITVIVTSIPLAQAIAAQPGIELIMIGGKYRHSEYSLVGYLAELGLRSFHVDKAFIGAAGIHPEAGITEYSYEQAGTKRVLIEQAKQRIVLADHTKFGKIQLATVSPLSNIDTIITDRGLAAEEAEKFRQLNFNLLMV
ncbi:MAG: DeoR/GlpR transcriptional regulator [Chloroflexi bacterium]|jgi:DeoR/GlpR family transcriptional regulator of sugar metabolism|nr:DeoR/GlpR family DNA-binding transcription regulator [Anaerolineaceae bacterium]NMB88082.1 DeoR/GlpR transcriptional regulator [Chloroflexota bacterium]